jgi:hypothetical protein
MGYKVVKQDHLPNNYFVSTVWLGLDHGWFDDIAPVIFETMVFIEGSWHDLECVRYTTEKAAWIGHQLIVQEYSPKLLISSSQAVHKQLNGIMYLAEANV